MKVCPNNMICFRETTLIILLIVLIFLVIFVYQSYTLSHYKTMENNLLNDDLNISLPNVVVSSSSCNDTLFDAYAGPYKNDQIKVRSDCNQPHLGVPVNIKTQSVDADFRQIGLLVSKKTDALILPLLGRPVITHRDTWQYYALSERNLKLPVIYDNKNCTNKFGCNSLSDGDNVRVNGYSDDFKVSLYENDTLKYIPVI
ncbi:hypothetical protein CL656_07125 [bacterium]|nr:hypothetical protein [bacterium]